MPEPARRCLLLVEDDQMVSDTIALMLEDEYDVLRAVSAAAAVSMLLDARSIDVVLLDCLLPEGKASNVVAVADGRAIPVVLISGDPNQAQAVDPNRPFLSKPFSQITLLLALDSAR